MRNNFVILFFFLLFSPIVFAQTNYQFLSGEHYYVPKHSIVPTQFVGSDETGFYVISTNLGEMSEVYLEHFDNNLNRTLSKKVKFLPDKVDRRYEYMYYSNDQLFILSSYPDYKLEKRFLEVQTVNKKTLALNPDLRQLIHVDNYSYEYGKFEFNISPDGKKLLVYCDYPRKKEIEEGKKIRSDRYVFSVFEGNMEKVWSREIIFPYKEKVFRVQSYEVNNHGNLLFLGAMFDGEVTTDIMDKDLVNGFVGTYSFKKMVKNSKSKDLSYKYVVLNYDGKEDNPMQYEISLDDKFLRDINMTIDINGDLICTGFYSKKGILSIKGVFYIRYNGATNEIKIKSYKEFSLDFITQGLNDWQMKEVNKQLEKGEDVEMYQYDLGNLIFMEDGSIFLLAEQFIDYSSNIDVSNNYSSRFYERAGGYYGGGFYGGEFFNLGYSGPYMNSMTKSDFNDILVIRIDREGVIQQFDRITKKQKATSDLYSSYGLATTKDHLYLFYNDNALNYNPKWKDKPYTFTGAVDAESVLVVAKIDMKGNITKEPTVSSRTSKIILNPKFGIQIAEKTVLIYGRFNSRLQYNKLILE